jgi:hypothetical protein
MIEIQASDSIPQDRTTSRDAHPHVELKDRTTLFRPTKGGVMPELPALARLRTVNRPGAAANRPAAISCVYDPTHVDSAPSRRLCSSPAFWLRRP